MSLIVYDYDAKNLDIDITANPNAYFNINGRIPKEDAVLDVLKRVEHVTRFSDHRFISDIHPDWGTTSMVNLSSGCKTFLNVYLFPEVCFGLRCCGKNFRDEILKLDKGTIVWFGMFESDLPMYEKCDIIYEDKHFTRLGDFLWEVWS